MAYGYNWYDWYTGIYTGDGDGGGGDGDGGYYGADVYAGGDGTYGSYASRYGSYGGYGFYGNYASDYTASDVTVEADNNPLPATDYTIHPNDKDHAITDNPTTKSQIQSAVAYTNANNKEAGFEQWQRPDGSIYYLTGIPVGDAALKYDNSSVGINDTLVLQFHTHPVGPDNNPIDPRPDDVDASGLQDVNLSHGGNGVGIVYGASTGNYYYYGKGSGSAGGGPSLP